MMIPCAKCRAPLAIGARGCAACGSPAVVLVSEPTDASCAVHRDRLPNGVCSRCGSFACATCLMRSRQALLCLKCAPVPAPARALVPLEEPDRALVSRVIRTWWAFVTSPGDSAELIAEGDVLWKPLLYSAWCWWLPLGTLGAVAGAASPSRLVEDVAIATLLAGACFVTWSFVMPLGEWVVLRAIGIQKPLRAVLRVAAYTGSPWAIPVCGVFVSGPVAFVFHVIALRRALRLNWLEALLAFCAWPVVFACVGIVTRSDLWLWG